MASPYRTTERKIPKLKPLLTTLLLVWSLALVEAAPLRLPGRQRPPAKPSAGSNVSAALPLISPAGAPVHLLIFAHLS